MATSREQVIMRLATDLKVWPESSISWKLNFDGWFWFESNAGGLELFSDNHNKHVTQAQWEAEIKRLSSPPTLPSIKWKEGDETTSGKIAYVSTDHHNVMVRGTHGMKELDGRSLKRKLTKDKFIAQQLAFYVGDMSQIEAFEKIIIDAGIDWEDG